MPTRTHVPFGPPQLRSTRSPPSGLIVVIGLREGNRRMDTLLSVVPTATNSEDPDLEDRAVIF